MLAAPGDSTNMVYHALRPDCVIIEKPVSSWQLFRRRAKKLGWKTAIGQVAFRLLIVPWLAFSSRRRIGSIVEQYQLSVAPIPETEIIHVNSVNDDATIRALVDAKPDVILVNGTRIIAERVLKSSRATFLNTHAGITPLYRGVHGGYWALATGDPANCGVTVHVVDPGIDTGGIVAQARIRSAPEDNFVTYPYLQLAAAVPLLKKAVAAAADGSLQLQSAPPGKSKLWTHPTIGEYLRSWVASGVK